MQKNKDKPICPYGKDCFYQHLNEDGTPYVFKDGVDVCMRVCNGTFETVLVKPLTKLYVEIQHVAEARTALRRPFYALLFGFI